MCTREKVVQYQREVFDKSYDLTAQVRELQKAAKIINKAVSNLKTKDYGLDDIEAALGAVYHYYGEPLRRLRDSLKYVKENPWKED